MLGAIGYAIPTEGVSIGDSTITFPRITEMLGGDSDETLDQTQAYIHAEQMRRFMITQRLSEELQRRMSVVRHKYAINYPQDSIEWIYPVFKALDGAMKAPIRVLHYGDSQIEIDRITSTLRRELMARFGGYGVGLIPAIQTIPTTAISQSCNKPLTRYMAYGPSEMRFDTAHYGIMGQTAQVDGTATFEFKATGMAQNCTKKFGHITVLTDLIEKPLTIKVTTATGTLTKTADCNTTSVSFALSDSTRQATVEVSGKGLIHAFLLDGDNKGLQYDNSAMRGCSGTIFTSIDSKSMKSYFDNYEVPLIILQYGGNVVPYAKTDKQIETYCHSLRRQINYLHRISPDSKILFIGPSDMATNINGEMTTYPHLKRLVNALRQMCLDNDVAFWSLYNAMGGENSMKKWVNQRPALAGSDHIHFTSAGAEYTGQMLIEALNAAYEYYKTEQGQKKEQ